MTTNSTNNQSDIDSDICCRADYREQYIRNVIEDIIKLETEFHTIKNIIHYNTESNKSPEMSLREFDTLTKLDYGLINIRDKVIWLRRTIKLLERELIENEV